MITVSFQAPTKFARAVQNLVKSHGGYFKCNPLDMWGQMRFDITFEGASCETYGKFMNKVHILNQNYV